MPEMQRWFGSMSVPQTKRASTPDTPASLPATPDEWKRSKRWQTLRKSWRPAHWHGPSSASGSGEAGDVPTTYTARYLHMTRWVQATEHETPRAAIDAARGESND